MNQESSIERVSPKQDLDFVSDAKALNLLSLVSKDQPVGPKKVDSVAKEFPQADAFADLLSFKNTSKIETVPASDEKMLAGLPSFGDIVHGVNKFGQDTYESTKRSIDGTMASWMRVSSGDATQMLENHHLKGSFTANCLKQLHETGTIKVGVIDDGNSSHSKNTIERLLASVPENLAGHVQVVLYDVSKGREKAFSDALRDAKNKDIVALSVSGGLEPVNLSKLTQKLGVSEINSSNSNKAFQAAIGQFDTSVQRQMLAVKESANYIPVVTPIWNDGNITPAALAGNVIVTSLKGDTHATRSSLPDYYLEPLPKNGFSSQGPPRVIGAMLGTIGTR